MCAGAYAVVRVNPCHHSSGTDLTPLFVSHGFSLVEFGGNTDWPASPRGPGFHPPCARPQVLCSVVVFNVVLGPEPGSLWSFEVSTSWAELSSP